METGYCELCTGTQGETLDTAKGCLRITAPVPDANQEGRHAYFLGEGSRALLQPFIGHQAATANSAVITPWPSPSADETNRGPQKRTPKP